MATYLTKPIVRETEIRGEDYIVALSVRGGEPLITLRKKGSRGEPLKFFLKDLLEDTPEEEKEPGLDSIPYNDVICRVAGLPSSVTKRQTLLEIVQDIYEVNILASDLSDKEVEAKGVALPE
jgi:hypothetical protein